MTYRTIMLCELLKLLRLRAEVYHNAKVCGDWLIPESELGQTCFHLPVEGECLLLIPGEKEQLLQTGDMVIFPRETRHTMLPTKPQTGQQQHLPYSLAQDNAVAMLCGKVTFEHRAHITLLDALPSHLIVSANDSKSWLPQLLTLIRRESYSVQPNPLVLDRLCELIFIYVLQGFSVSTNNGGILKLYSMEKIRPALEAIHRHPERSWTLETLALKCNMSRTVFAKTFSQSNWTAMRYLTWWRMQQAWSLLSDGDILLNIAFAVGYRSEAAFSRAFLKEFGLRPGQVRRGKV
ncbi:AraC family transcriptional regulator [Gilvimarinus sp. SDUM040013]|uniref:AraC family transcriptional regulator n=1 Tax=Gilvimarinus gilvus TaxID=3058038 RepID=A0ABU4S185_9GAMM|nr:AraC family transcriptional regulator [Gilvimarinus sp. SDUM040013]MDO3385370.1 AraC family transcriptional regulator [Gilvimarinus sp. SDUM040013]MDX6850945.1 AraC family transcriptional regulator [Gilvimarinus sp. SDUM040013]